MDNMHNHVFIMYNHLKNMLLLPYNEAFISTDNVGPLLRTVGQTLALGLSRAFHSFGEVRCLQSETRCH